jgi:predicted TIM-barrel fold metal-dependent hydrolase
MGLIDSDVHPHVNSMDDIRGYLPQAWQRRFTDSGLTLPGRSANRYPHPTGVMRKDATPPGGGLPASDPEYARKDLLDAYDVDAAILIPLQASSVTAWTDRVQSAVFLSAINDYFLDHWPTVDRRFRVAVTVNCHDPEQGAEEIRRLASREGVVAVSLPLLDTLMGSKYYWPIYEACTETDLPVLVHFSGSDAAFIGTPTVAGGIPRTYAERHSLLPQIAQSNIASLVFEGTFERFADLRVVFVEYGFAWLLAFMWRLDREWQNFRADVPWVKRPPSEYIVERLRFTTQPIDEPGRREHLWQLMEHMSAGRMLMFSSDYPHYDTDNPIVIGGSWLPEGMRDDIMFRNAREFYGARLG